MIYKFLAVMLITAILMPGCNDNIEETRVRFEFENPKTEIKTIEGVTHVTYTLYATETSKTCNAEDVVATFTYFNKTISSTFYVTFNFGTIPVGKRKSATATLFISVADTQNFDPNNPRASGDYTTGACIITNLL